jgi:hypothetical protein
LTTGLSQELVSASKLAFGFSLASGEHPKKPQKKAPKNRNLFCLSFLAFW